ncbi:MAG TPA: GspMb/PilO family protein [Candidatus Polarisedimenticolaceae bacterium]|nr:GspMb/PilO family protein [Candidatus Polarisedimenticolaceae bacterium]
MTAPRARFDIRRSSGQIALVLGALLLANVVVSIVLVRPKVAEWRQLTDETGPHRKVVKDREKEVQQRETYAASLNKARDDMKRLAEDVLSTRQRRMIAVQLEVTKLVKEFGIAADRVQYDNPTSDNGAMERFGIQVPLQGGYTNLRKFIHAVESSDNFLVIEKVALGQGKTPDSVELNITLATYFIAPDAKLDQLGKKPVAPPKES